MPMPVSVAPTFYPELKVDLRSDIAPIGQMAWSYNVLVVHPEVPAISSCAARARMSGHGR
jgi:hypothetical protein